MRRLVFIIFALAGCDARPPVEAAAGAATRAAPTFKASCSTPKLSVCSEYTDAAFALGEEVLKIGCTQSHGAWSPARCPSAKRLGSCTLTGTHRLYYPGGEHEFSGATAAKDCTELYQGSWAAN